MKLQSVYEYFKAHEEDYFPFEMKYKTLVGLDNLEIWLNCDFAKVKEEVAEVWQLEDYWAMVCYHLWGNANDRYEGEHSKQYAPNSMSKANYCFVLPEDEEECIALFIDKIEDAIEEERKHLDSLLQCVGYYRM